MIAKLLKVVLCLMHTPVINKKQGEVTMKKLHLKLLLAVALSVCTMSTLLTGCGSQDTVSGSSEVSKDVAESSATGEISVESTVEEDPVKMPEEVSIWGWIGGSATNAGAKDANDVKGFQLIEEMTGTHINWEISSGGTQEELFNLLIAGGNYPDLITYYWSGQECETFAEDEVIVELTDLIPEYMPNFWAFLEANPDKKKVLQNDDGKIFYIPYIREDIELCIYLGPVMRKDWLEKLGLDVPNTPDELYTVLKEFKEQDPNGNGKQDEIPMSGQKFAHGHSGIGYLLNAFNTHWTFYLKDGEVVYGPMTDEYVEGIEYIAKLYSEGLIDIDYLQNDRTMMDGKFMNNEVGFVYGFQPTKYYNNMHESGAYVEGIGHFKSADGIRHTYNSTYTESVMSTSVALTTACENVEGTLMWLDTFFSEEGTEAMNFGEEGVDFNYVDGVPVFTEESTAVDPNTNVSKFGLVSAQQDSYFPCLQQWEAYSQSLSPWGAQAIAKWGEEVDISLILPALSFTQEENAAITDTENAITTYVDECVNKVIIGKMTVAEWTDVQKKITEMGLEQVLEVYNAAYQRYLNK